MDMDSMMAKMKGGMNLGGSKFSEDKHILVEYIYVYILLYQAIRCFALSLR